MGNNDGVQVFRIKRQSLIFNISCLLSVGQTSIPIVRVEQAAVDQNLFPVYVESKIPQIFAI